MQGINRVQNVQGYQRPVVMNAKEKAMVFALLVGSVLAKDDKETAKVVFAVLFMVIIGGCCYGLMTFLCKKCAESAGMFKKQDDQQKKEINKITEKSVKIDIKELDTNVFSKNRY